MTTVCPHCGAMQGEPRGSRCWLCRLSLEAPVEVPSPPRPLPVDGPDGRATAVALVVGLVSVGGGALLISGGFGLVATLIVVLPCAWVLGDTLLSRHAPPPAARPEPDPVAAGPGRRALKIVGWLIAVVVLGPLSLMVALFACCVVLWGGAWLASLAAAVNPVAGVVVCIVCVCMPAYWLISSDL